MLRSSRFLAVAAMVTGAILFGGSNRAEAALRLTLTSGASTQQFFSATNVLVAPTTIDGYTIVVETVLTNFPGFATGGTLSTATLLQTAAMGIIDDLTVLAEVVTAADAMAGLAMFTAPTGSALFLTSNVTGVGGTATSGEVDFRSTANGFNVDVNDVSIPGLQDASNVGVFAGPGGYTLTNRTIISGLGNNVAGVGITGSSTVSPVPEPATLATAIAGLGLLGGVGWLRRRKQPTS